MSLQERLSAPLKNSLLKKRDEALSALSRGVGRVGALMGGATLVRKPSRRAEGTGAGEGRRLVLHADRVSALRLMRALMELDDWEADSIACMLYDERCTQYCFAPWDDSEDETARLEDSRAGSRTGLSGTV